MAERAAKTRRADPSRRPAPVAKRSREADESERALGRIVAVGLPAAAVVGAAVVGLMAGFGSALLVLAAAALLGAIALLWASVRTLSGDAPLPVGFEGVGLGQRAVDDLAEQKRRVLRALKDLESEHALGKIDDADYRAVAAKYRDEAKAVMREMDSELAPRIEEAERIAREYLVKHPAVPGAADAAPPAPPEEPERDRAACPKCGTSNEADATFCKQCGASMRAAEDGKAVEKVDAPS